MVTVKLTGQVLPSHIKISVDGPELQWKWQEESLEPKFRTKIENSTIMIECEIQRYEPRFITEIYKRASDLTRAMVNMVVFATGYSLIATLDTFIDGHGIRFPLHRQENVPAEFRTAIGLGQEKSADFARTARIVLSDPSLFMAFDDLAKALTSFHTQVADCGRVIDRIRRMIAPSAEGAPAWRKMHEALNIAQPYQEWVSKLSTGSRHGDAGYLTPAVCTEVLYRTWAILNRFIEYRKEGDRPLAAPEFPQLT